MSGPTMSTTTVEYNTLRQPEKDEKLLLFAAVLYDHGQYPTLQRIF